MKKDLQEVAKLFKYPTEFQQTGASFYRTEDPICVGEHVTKMTEVKKVARLMKTTWWRRRSHIYLPETRRLKKEDA